MGVIRILVFIAFMNLNSMWLLSVVLRMYIESMIVM